MAMTKGVMVRAALSQASRWKRTARIRIYRSSSTPARSGAARPAGWPWGGGRDADGGGFCRPAGAFILTYDATIGEAQNTAYR
jgi:hypothetical protein